MDILWITIVLAITRTYGDEISAESRHISSAFVDDEIFSETRLMFNLMTTYDQYVHSVDDGPVNVRFGMTLLSLDFIDEVNEMVSAHLHIEQSWNDDRLRWDPTDFNGTLKMNANHLWVPDIEPFNGVSITQIHDFLVRIDSDGNLFRVIPYRINFVCRMNLRFFPYDKQKCQLIFGSWNHNSNIVNLTLARQALDLSFHNPSTDFVLKDAQVIRNVRQYDCCPESYIYLTYTFDLERSSGAYSVKLVLPAVLTGFLILATFLLPTASFERITLCGILFVSLLLQLSYLNTMMPFGGDTLLGQYLAFAIFVDFFATIIAVVSYNVKSMLSVRRAQHGSKAELADDVVITSNRYDWLRYLDIVGFVLFSVVFIVGLAVILGRRE